MGWARTLLLGDIGNRLDIEDTERDVSSLRRQISQSVRRDMTQDQQLKHLVEENGELKLCLAALVRLLIQKKAITKEELESLVQAVDAEDGQKDGRFMGDVV